MNETIKGWYDGSGNKKYKVVVKDKNTKKERTIQFGSQAHEQYKDSSPIGKYGGKDHGDKKRRENYYKRHSGVKTKREALKKEKSASGGYYTPKILSHQYLW